MKHTIVQYSAKIVLHGYYKVNTSYAREMILLYVRRSLSRKEAYNRS